MEEKGKTYRFIVSDDETEERLDRFLADSVPEHSRSFIQKLIRRGDASVNDKSVKPSYTLEEGDRIVLKTPPPEDKTPLPEDIDLDIIYQDEDIIVVNKPADMVVHPGAGNKTGTLVNALLYHCGELSSIGGIQRPGIVHRLDKDTTGILVVAKNDQSHESLAKQLFERTLERYYKALVTGEVEKPEGIIDAPIGRHPVNRLIMTVKNKNGKKAVTHYKIIKRCEGVTLLELKLETGRTHQIRVHMQHMGHPVMGDSHYGGLKKERLEGVPPWEKTLIGKLKKATSQLLHAEKLIFRHPRTGEIKSFIAPLPPLFSEIIDLL